MTTSTQAHAGMPGAARRGHHPGLALAVIATSQLMVVLDATIVNVALPTIQTALKFSYTNLTWVLNAYTLTFGGLLLLGGRAGDILGRRRVFVFGILLFTFASFLGGLATSSWWLLAARSLQGVGGAIASPTALSLITTNFEEGAERNRAFGVFAAVSGSGAAIGLLAGGMLTSWASWRWVLFVNVPIGIFIASIARQYINESEKHPGRFDIVGAITSTLGMTALVYAFIRASGSAGWGDTLTLVCFAAAVVLLVWFIVNEMRSPQPITPLHMFKNRNRSGSYVVMLFLAGALFAMFFFLTVFVQRILHYSPLKTGFIYLPLSAAIVVSAQICAKQLVKVGPKPFMVVGAVMCAVALWWLSLVNVHSGYVANLLGPLVIFGLGMGFMFVPLTMVAVSGVEPEEAGSASGLLNVTQQVGGSLGLAILTTAFATAQRHAAAHGATGDAKLAHGISTALQVSVVFGIAALLASIFLITAKASDLDPSAMPGMGG
jgi:EmrB/QacA subfamily drug resistance transporter